MPHFAASLFCCILQHLFFLLVMEFSLLQWLYFSLLLLLWIWLASLYAFVCSSPCWGLYLFFEVWVQRSLVLVNTAIVFISLVSSFCLFFFFNWDLSGPGSKPVSPALESLPLSHQGSPVASFWGHIFFTHIWSHFFPPFLRDFCLWLFPRDPQFWKSLCSRSQLFADPQCWELPELSWWNLSAGSCLSFLDAFSLTLCPRVEWHVCPEAQTTQFLFSRACLPPSCWRIRPRTDLVVGSAGSVWDVQDSQFGGCPTFSLRGLRPFT